MIFSSSLSLSLSDGGSRFSTPPGFIFPWPVEHFGLYSGQWCPGSLCLYVSVLQDPQPYPAVSTWYCVLSLFFSPHACCLSFVFLLSLPTKNHDAAKWFLDPLECHPSTHKLFLMNLTSLLLCSLSVHFLYCEHALTVFLCLTSIPISALLHPRIHFNLLYAHSLPHSVLDCCFTSSAHIQHEVWQIYDYISLHHTAFI